LAARLCRSMMIFWQVNQEGPGLGAGKDRTRRNPALRARLPGAYWEFRHFPKLPKELKIFEGCGIENTATIERVVAGNALKGRCHPPRLAGHPGMRFCRVRSVGIFKPDGVSYELSRPKVRLLHAFASAVCIVQWLGCSGRATALASRQPGSTRAGDPMGRLPWKPVHVLQDLNGHPKNWRRIMAHLSPHRRAIASFADEVRGYRFSACGN